MTQRLQSIFAVSINTVSIAIYSCWVPQTEYNGAKIIIEFLIFVISKLSICVNASTQPQYNGTLTYNPMSLVKYHKSSLLCQYGDTAMPNSNSQSTVTEYSESVNFCFRSAKTRNGIQYIVQSLDGW